MDTERCHHCGYGIPTDASSCPGCARAHVRLGGRAARRHRSPLLRIARWTRRAFVLTGWCALAAGVAALTRFVAERPRLSEDVSATTLDRLGDTAHGLVLASLGLAVLSVAALWTWSARARRNLGPLALERRWGTPWALSGWLSPGAEARRGRLAVDDLWRDRSPVLASLPGAGWTRRPISLVVLHWWTPWTGLPAVTALVALAVAGPEDLSGELALVGLAGAALAVASLRALYDVVGVVTFAQAHRAERIVRERDALLWERTPAGAPPAPDRDLDDAHDADDVDAGADLEPLAR